MRKSIWLLPAILLLMCASMAQAEVDARVVRTLKLKSTPVDLAIPGKGRYIYVLTIDSNIKVFKNTGELVDTVRVDIGIDRIKPGPKEDRLYLVNSTNNQIQVLNLDFIHDIPVDGSPVKGSDDAKVMVTVFTDFQ